LATHASGLPRLPDNLTPVNESDPYVDYSASKLQAFLTNYSLHAQPGSTYEYSNLGAGLLGYALSLKDGRSYEAMIVGRICNALGMDDTRIAMSSAQNQRLAIGYAQGRSAAPWNWDVLAGAGAIRSTVADTLRFLSAQLSLTQTSLSSAIALTQRQHTPSALPPGIQASGMDWLVTPMRASGTSSKTIYWHNGETGGFSSVVAFTPEQKKGVVILANSSVPDGVLENAAFRILGLDY
jgi:CubicO group peptidase (beta-lactamase class C family)